MGRQDEGSAFCLWRSTDGIASQDLVCGSAGTLARSAEGNRGQERAPACLMAAFPVQGWLIPREARYNTKISWEELML